MSQSITLLIMRHAKSDWSRNTHDFERPLNPRGIRDATRMGRWLAAQDKLPGHIVSSPAQRASATAMLFCEGAKLGRGKIIYDKALYEADLETLIAVAETQLKSHKTPMLIGHNPSVSLLLNYLTGLTHTAMTTANIAIVSFSKYRAPLSQNVAKLMTLAQPKTIKQDSI